MTKQKGIDISYWQGKVDFAKVKADGVKFAILRSGFSQTVDKQFHEYVQGCKNAGIPVLGVYHFSYALNAEQAKQEAAFCIEQVKKAGLAKDVIVFFDFEYDTVNKAKDKGVKLGKSECIAHTKAFCEKVESLGYRAGIYSNIDYYKNMYDKDLLAKYVFWLAHYTTGDPAYSCSFQQYSSSGKVSGISGNVDMDWYFGEVKKNADSNTDAKKSVTEVAQEVLAGKWGNGDARKTALENAGYSYSEVQAKVNELAGAKASSSTATKKTVAEVAQEVLAGKWGNGADRKTKLQAAGYDYAAVQAEVNRLASGSSAKQPTKSVTEIAKEVINGKWGNGDDRKKKLEAAGYNYSEVQAKVNALLK